MSAPRYEVNEVMSASICFLVGSFPTKRRVKKIVRRNGAGGTEGWGVGGEFTAELRISAKDLKVELSVSSILIGNLGLVTFLPAQTWNMDSISDEGNTYSFWGHFVKGQGKGHFHGHFSGHNSYHIILIQYKFPVAGPNMTWSVF